MQAKAGSAATATARKHRQGKAWLRSGVIGALILLYVLLFLYFQLGLKIRVVYTHFAYIPIVVTGLWWGRKSVFVAVLLAAIPFPFHVLGEGAGELWSDAGRMVFFVAVALTVGTLRDKLAAGQEALESSERRYRLIIEKSLAGIFVYRDEKILFASERLERLLGYEPGALTARPVGDLFHERERRRIRKLMSSRSEGDLRYEARLVTRDQRTLWADIASSRLDYEGSPSVLVNVYDITARKEAERKRQELMKLAHEQEEQLVHSTRLAELGEMAAAIAHEINQPLTGIRNFARNAAFMIEEDAGRLEDVRENLERISEQVDRASRIIKQMRELTRKAESQFIPVDINTAVWETLEFLGPQVKLAGIEVRLALAEDLPPVRGDKIRLQQVFLNIVTNAIQAMEESEVRRLEVSTTLDPSSAHPLTVEIADTGRGFDDELAEKIFAPFFTTKKTGLGTGLGLSISLRIIKDHHGLIKAEGTPGKGARFMIHFPVSEEAALPGEAEDRGKNE